MKTLTVVQTPILDHHEYDSQVVRQIPEETDLGGWSKPLQIAALKYLALPVETIVEHLIKCSTPPVPCGLNPKGLAKRARQLLLEQFGVTYMIN